MKSVEFLISFKLKIFDTDDVEFDMCEKTKKIGKNPTEGVLLLF